MPLRALITDLEAEGKTGTVTMADAIKRHFELNMEVIKDLPMAKREALYMFSIHGNGFWEWQNLEMRNYARSADTMLSQIKQRSLNRLVGLPQIVGKNHVADELLHINAMMQKAAPSYYDVWVKETAFFIGTKAGGVAMGPIETMLRNKSPAVIQIIDKIKPAEWLAPNAPYSEAQMTLMIDKYRHPKNTDELKTLVSLLQIQEGRMRMPKPHAPE